MDRESYARLHQAVAMFCTASLSTHDDTDRDWHLDGGDRDIGIDRHRFETLCQELAKRWAPRFDCSEAQFLTIWTEELVDSESGRLKEAHEIHPYSFATRIHNVLASMSPHGSWEPSSLLYKLLQLDPAEPLTRLQATQAVAHFLDHAVPSDSRWSSRRNMVMTWLAKRQSTAATSDLHAQLDRLQVSFDQAPLMRLRFDPLTQAARALIVSAFMGMEASVLVDNLAWLRSMDCDTWRVFTSPIGQPPFQSAVECQRYFEMLERFPLKAPLFGFCNRQSISNHHDLLVFLHAVSPAQRHLFRQMLEWPAPRRGIATTRGVSVAVAFFQTLPATERTVFLEFLQTAAAFHGQEASSFSPRHNFVVPLTAPSRHVPLRAKQMRKSTSQPLKPLGDRCSPKPVLALDSSEPARHSRGQLPPSTVWKDSNLSPNRRSLEAKYFASPKICHRTIEFDPPDHLRKVRPHGLSALGLDSTWVSPVDLSDLGSN
ncbi:hypothetical protein Ae201684_016839 [Aphanomyces euteiches]|uniref:Uncharacterized protein n=1 Tax=Aphanomyces euteiches TaxID=100861 RepID=A0A6G0WDU0_9STRA|nr:hypothetical protein Ae201684_016839 [Aphanomyces euteiches]KAH9152327.1 hypothetical protein AeRB84_005227 [Aphanomyces euteiches]